MLELLVGHIGLLYYLAFTIDFPFFNFEIWQSSDSIFRYDLSYTLEVEIAKFLVS